MKRLILIISIMLLALIGQAQNYDTFFHHGEYRLQQCYGTIEMSDGNLLVREAVFDDGLNDVGYNLYKITRQGELLDSLFVEDHHIYSLFPMLKDPNEDNSNIMTSFYCEDNKNYYKAVYFNDELEITDEVVAQIPSSFAMDDITTFKSLIDSNNDIIVRMKIDGTNCKFLRVGLDGQLKCESEALNIGDRGCPENSLFVLTESPLRYGFITCSTNYLYITTLDSDLNAVSEKSIRKFGDYYFSYAVSCLNAWHLDDSHFLLTTMVTMVGSGTTEMVCVAEFSSDMELETFRVWGDGNDVLVNKNLAVTEDCVYVAWQDKKTSGQSSSKQTLALTCLDRNLGLEWTSYTISVEDRGLLANYGVLPLSGNSVVISGWLADELLFYQSKDIYSIIFENTSLLTPEEQQNCDVFRCYPNPSSTSVSLEISPDVKDNVNAVSVYDIAGRTVKTQTTGFESVDISSLAPGIYVMKVTLADGRAFEEKIVKE